MPSNDSNLNKPYWNPDYSCWIRIASNGIPHSLESRLRIKSTRGPQAHDWAPKGMSPESAKDIARSRWVPISETPTTSVPTTDIGASQRDANLKELKYFFTASMLRKSPAKRAALEVASELLDNLSPFDVMDALEDMKYIPESRKSSFKDEIVAFAQEKTDRLFGERGHYPNKVGQYPTSYIRSISVKGEKKEVAKHTIFVKHPKAGKLLFRRVSEDGDTPAKWEPFDGLTESGAGSITDSTRSTLLQGVGLGKHLEEVTYALNNADQGALIPPTGIGYEDIMVNDVDSFNDLFTEFRHTPTDISDRESLRKLETRFIKDPSNLLGEGSDVGDFLRDNPKVAYGLLNDLNNFDYGNLEGYVNNFREHGNLALGHLDLHTDPEPVLKVFQEREERDELNSDEGDPLTGYNPPVYLSGEEVPDKARTSAEKRENRQHYEDLYGRAESWIQHTEEGRATFDSELQLSKDEFEENGGIEVFSRSITNDSYYDILFPESVNKEDRTATSKLFISDSKWVDADGEDREGHPLNGKTMKEIIENIDNEDISSFLNQNSEVMDVLAYIAKTDKARLAFGVDDETEGIDKMMRENASNSLLGAPAVSLMEANDWEELSKTDTGTVELEGFGTILVDDLYKKRTQGKLRLEKGDGDGEESFNLSIMDTETGDLRSINVPDAIFQRTRSKNGKDTTHLKKLSTVDSSVLDQFVRDGLLPVEYASSTEVEVKDGAPKAPDFGTDEMIARASALSTKLAAFNLMRGVDRLNGGVPPYSLDPDDPQAQMLRFTTNTFNGVVTGGTSILDEVYNFFNKNLEPENQLVNSLGEEAARERVVGKYATQAPQTAEAENTSKPSQIRASTMGEPNRSLGVDAGIQNETSEASEAAAGLLLQQEDNVLRNATAESLGITEEELNTARNNTRDQLAASGYGSGGNSTKKPRTAAGSGSGGNRTRKQRAGASSSSDGPTIDLDNDKAFKAYRDERENNMFADVLADAPLDVRATAYRMRIQGLQDRLDNAETMGEAYDISRDWMRAGVVEYPDMIAIDRDGTSKFKKLRNGLSDKGVDWTEVNHEWVEHGNVQKAHQDHLEAIQEKVDFLNETFPDMGSEDANDQDEAASRTLKLLNDTRRGLEQNSVPSFGSQKHVDMLNNIGDPLLQFNDPDRAEAYKERNGTAIGDGGGLTTTLKGTKNAVTAALAAGLTTWSESRLIGQNPLTAFLQSVISTIGEGTGIGADRIRGLDLTKPLEQMPEDPKGIMSIFKIPKLGKFSVPKEVPVFGRPQTVYEQNKKAAGLEGVRLDPQQRTPEEEAALSRVERAGRVTPSTDPDPDSNPEPNKERYTQTPGSEDTPEPPTSDTPTPNPSPPQPPKMTREDLESDPSVQAYIKQAELNKKKPKTESTLSEDPFGGSDNKKPSHIPPEAR